MMRCCVCCFLLGLGGWLAPCSAWSQPPGRVVSINACTDQLAMLLAHKDQLVSVTRYALDGKVSPMTELGRKFKINRGDAEEILLLKPDLVLAGRYTRKETIELLTRLGIRVEMFYPARSLKDIKNHLRQMARLLGSEAKARHLTKVMDDRLREIATSAAKIRNAKGAKTIAIYYANGYISGTETLVDEVINLAGMTNLAARLNITGSTTISLEALIAAKPDFILRQMEDYGAPALAEENLNHPALNSITSYPVRIPSSYWICGTPFVVDALRILVKALDHGFSDKANVIEPFDWAKIARKTPDTKELNP